MSILNEVIEKVNLKDLNNEGIIDGQHHWFIYEMDGILYWNLNGICKNLKEILGLDNIEVIHGYNDNCGFFTRLQVSNISIDNLASIIKENKETIMNSFVEEGRELRFSSVDVM